MKKNILGWMAICWLVLFWPLILQPRSSPSPLKKEKIQRPTPVIIEENLFKFVNQEREKQSLPLLTLSPELSHLARAHSQDMAQQQKLSHLASSRKDYTERLTEKGFYFMERGENVVFSETFKPEFIHQSLMASPAHRENILDPKFDQVGIGVILKEEKGYYITQDFIQSLRPKNDDEARTYLKDNLNNLRISHSLQSVYFSKDLDSYASRYSQAKAQNSSSPPPPSGFGANLIIFTATPYLEVPFSSHKDEILSENFKTAGLGVKFSRTKKYPGGAYFITLILIVENKYKSLPSEELRKLVLGAINKARQRAALGPLKEDLNLSLNRAQLIAGQASHREISALDLSNFGEDAVYCYLTEKPGLLPFGLTEKIRHDLARYKKVGIGIHFRKTQEFPSGIFWVAVIFK